MPKIGFKHTIESIEKMRQAKLGKILSFKHRQNISKAQLGNKYCLGNKLSKEHKKNLSKVHRGLRVSEEAKEKIRQTLLGHKISLETKEKISQKLSGRKLSEETKKRLRNKIITDSFREKCRERFKKNKNPLWKGGITPINKIIRGLSDYQLWRDFIFTKNNYTCQDCRTKSGNGKKVYLHAHHIKSFSKYPELRFDMNNGITLCMPCHQNKHFTTLTKGG